MRECRERVNVFLRFAELLLIALEGALYLRLIHAEHNSETTCANDFRPANVRHPFLPTTENQTRFDVAEWSVVLFPMSQTVRCETFSFQRLKNDNGSQILFKLNKKPIKLNFVEQKSTCFTFSKVRKTPK